MSFGQMNSLDVNYFILYFALFSIMQCQESQETEINLNQKDLFFRDFTKNYVNYHS